METGDWRVEQKGLCFWEQVFSLIGENGAVMVFLRKQNSEA